jgi:hypothetical protein
MGRSSGYGLQFAQDLGGLVREGMTNQNPYYEPIASESSQKFSAQGPYGLRGDLGPTGAVGPAGTAGAAGAIGPVGPTGPAVNPDTLSFNSVKIGNWEIKAQGEDLLFDDRSSNEDDATMFKINRTSGASIRNSDTTTSGGQQPQQDPHITSALNEIQEAINMLRLRIDEKVEDGLGFVEIAAYLRNNASENNQKAQEFAEQNQPTEQFVMMADLWYNKVVEIRDRVLDNYYVARQERQSLYNLYAPRINASNEVRTKFEELNAVVNETETIVSTVNGYMYEAQSYKSNVESIHAFNQQRQQQQQGEFEQWQREEQEFERDFQARQQQQQEADYAAWSAQIAAEDAAANAQYTQQEEQQGYGNWGYGNDW